MGGNLGKNTPLECMVENFKKAFNGDYGVKLTPKKLKALCELDWSAFWSRVAPRRVDGQNCD
jgi:hypothetical protein